MPFFGAWSKMAEHEAPLVKSSIVGAYEWMKRLRPLFHQSIHRRALQEQKIANQSRIEVMQAAARSISSFRALSFLRLFSNSTAGRASNSAILFSKSSSMTLAQTFQTHKICLNTTAAHTGLLGVVLCSGIDTLRYRFLAIVIAKTKHHIPHELSHSRCGALFGTSKHSAELLQFVIIHRGPSSNNPLPKVLLDASGKPGVRYTAAMELSGH
jgi:hypothetical protein